MIIDIHAHIAFHKLTPQYFLKGVQDDILKTFKNQEGYELNEKMVENIILNSLKDFDCSKLLKQMDQANIDKTVLLAADWHYDRTDCEYSIDEVHEYYHDIYSKHPDKFILFAGADPRRGFDGVHFFESCPDF